MTMPGLGIPGEDEFQLELSGPNAAAEAERLEFPPEPFPAMVCSQELSEACCPAASCPPRANASRCVRAARAVPCTAMDIDQARDFARRHHRAVMTTYFPDGRAQLSPVTVGVDGAGRVIVSTRETATKTRNLARDPRVVLCVFTDGFYGQWVLIEGEAEITHLPEAMEPLVDYYRGISGEHPDWADYRAAMERDRRVLVRITISRAGPDRHG